MSAFHDEAPKPEVEELREMLPMEEWIGNETYVRSLLETRNSLVDSVLVGEVDRRLKLKARKADERIAAIEAQLKAAQAEIWQLQNLNSALACDPQAINFTEEHDAEVRRKTLEEAAAQMCQYCAAKWEVVDYTITSDRAMYLHLRPKDTVGFPAVECGASPIRARIDKEKL